MLVLTRSKITENGLHYYRRELLYAAISLLLGANIRCIPEFVSTYVFVNVHPVFSVESLAFLLAATMVTGRKIGSLLVLHHAEVIVSLT